MVESRCVGGFRDRIGACWPRLRGADLESGVADSALRVSACVAWPRLRGADFGWFARGSPLEDRWGPGRALAALDLWPDFSPGGFDGLQVLVDGD